MATSSLQLTQPSSARKCKQRRTVPELYPFFLLFLLPFPPQSMLQESLVMDQNLQDYELSTHYANINPPLEVKKTGSSLLNKCSQCDFASDQAGDLRTHLKIHSGENANKCNQCNFSSIWVSALTRHLKAHRRKKPNKCNQCEFSSGNLRAHLKTHSGEKSNKCNQCDYACSDPSSLHAHLKTHSGEK